MSKPKLLPPDFRLHIDELTDSELRDYLLFLGHTGDYDMTAYLSNPTLKEEAKRSLNTVKEGKAGLLRKGWLARTGDYKQPRNGGEYDVPVMEVLAPWLPGWSETVRDIYAVLDLVPTVAQSTVAQNLGPEGSGYGSVSDSDSASRSHSHSDYPDAPMTPLLKGKPQPTPTPRATATAGATATANRTPLRERTEQQPHHPEGEGLGLAASSRRSQAIAPGAMAPPVQTSGTPAAEPAPDPSPRPAAPSRAKAAPDGTPYPPDFDDWKNCDRLQWLNAHAPAVAHDPDDDPDDDGWGSPKPSKWAEKEGALPPMLPWQVEFFRKHHPGLPLPREARADPATDRPFLKRLTAPCHGDHVVLVVEADGRTTVECRLCNKHWGLEQCKYWGLEDDEEEDEGQWGPIFDPENKWDWNGWTKEQRKAFAESCPAHYRGILRLCEKARAAASSSGQETQYQTI